MSAVLKCPNPSCPYVFDPSQVPVGVVLSCPRCSTQFTLGPPRAAPPGPPAPTGATAGMSAPGYPVGAPTQETEFPAAEESESERRGSELHLPSRGTNRLQVFFLAAIAAVLMAGTGLALFFKLMNRGKTTPEPGDSVTRYPDINIGMEPLPAGWSVDDDLRLRLESPFMVGFRKENPEAYAAFGAFDPRNDRDPRPRMMRVHLYRPFPKLFVMDRFREEPPVATTWLGTPIAATEPFQNGVKFRALSADGLVWAGEAYTVSHKGIAYYWLSWCKETDFEEQKADFAAFRDKFKTLDLRANWTPKQSNYFDYKGDKTPYTITDSDPDPKESWKEVAPHEFQALKAVEPDLDRRLYISVTPEWDNRARPDTAELSVYVIDGAGDPTQAARKYAESLETTRIKSAGADFTLTFKELTPEDPVLGDDVPKASHASTPVVRLLTDVKESRGASQLMVVSGTQVGGKIVAVICTCPLPKRKVFEKKFVQIASSLR